jgi:putative transcriptional regulator
VNEGDSLRGQLLIASPALIDPNFWRTVVVIADHNDEGAFGLVLNRPSETEVSEAVPDLASVEGVDPIMHLGGPVAPSNVVVVADFDDRANAGLMVVGDVGLLSLEAEVGEAAAGARRLRAYAGHSGWGPGQLEAEMGLESWILEPARESDLFHDEPENLWSEVLRRKGGSYSLIARMPADASMN